MRSVGVFCSAQALDGRFDQAAAGLAQGLVRRGYRLIYGGSNGGLMGVLADQVLAAGGHVTGVIPHCLARGTREVAHAGLTELEYVEDMMERKRRMMELSDAFVILPGGWGTLDESLDALTYKMLGLHQKPVVFLNIDGFWNAQLAFFSELVKSGALRAACLNLYEVCTDLQQMWGYLDGQKNAET